MARRSEARALPFNLHFILIAFCLFGPAVAQDGAKKRYINDIKVRFFDTVSMTCDHELLDIAASTDVEKISWVFPDGTNVFSSADVDPKLYTFQEPKSVTTLELYNLTALDVDEDQFGYYFCVVEYSEVSKKSVAVIRWGLNVNGADFSELLKRYRQNAIIGGAAAAVVLLLVGGACLFCNIWNSSRDPEDDDGEYGKAGRDGVAVSRGNNESAFHNTSFKGDADDEAVVDVYM